LFPDTPWLFVFSIPPFDSPDQTDHTSARRYTICFGEKNRSLFKRRTGVANHDNDEVVRVATAANPVQAHTFRQALEEEGIRCQVVGEYLDAAIGDIPGVSPEIWVHKRDLARAEEILRQGQEAPKSETVDETEL